MKKLSIIICLIGVVVGLFVACSKIEVGSGNGDEQVDFSKHMNINTSGSNSATLLEPQNPVVQAVKEFAAIENVDVSNLTPAQQM